MKNKEIKEVGYLYLIQVVNFILPILLMSYLPRILGMDSYGKLSFYQISSGLMVFLWILVLTNHRHKNFQHRKAMIEGRYLATLNLLNYHFPYR